MFKTSKRVILVNQSQIWTLKQIPQHKLKYNKHVQINRLSETERTYSNDESNYLKQYSSVTIIVASVV